MDPVIMRAKVLRVRRDHLLVLDRETGQTVQVNTPAALRWRPGDLIRIEYSGAMTMSIPPQISASRITRDCRC